MLIGPPPLMPPASYSPCHVTIFSETGIPHAAVMFETPGGKTWMSFGPKEGSIKTGTVAYRSRQADISNYVRFSIPCCRLFEVQNLLVPKWVDSIYVMGFRDCVSFAKAVVETCGLTTNYVEMTPYGLVQTLRQTNAYTNYNDKPYPWK